jgi:hypothetical protein
MLLEVSGIAASVNPRALTAHSKARGVTENQHAKKRMRTLARSRAGRSQYAATRYSGVSAPVRSHPISPKVT